MYNGLIWLRNKDHLAVRTFTQLLVVRAEVRAGDGTFMPRVVSF